MRLRPRARPTPSLLASRALRTVPRLPAPFPHFAVPPPAAPRALPRLRAVAASLTRENQFSTMPPVPSDNAAWAGEPAAAVKAFVDGSDVAVFSKSWCPYCAKVKALFDANKIKYSLVELDKLPEDKMDAIQDHLKSMTGIRSVPQVFVHGAFFGDSGQTAAKFTSGELEAKLKQGKETHEYEFDLAVIGGGSGGLACAREAAKLGKKVALLDHVRPSPHGTKWGLGGTCVNVGCIPKKLMHQAALVGQAIKDAKDFGWEVDHEKIKFSWDTLRAAVQDHIGSLNWGYRVALRDENVEYFNARGAFIDAHTVACTTFDRKTDQPKSTKNITAKEVVVATGGRPKQLDVPGWELAISSDDLFSLAEAPGKTLVVGASYVALECAGFLTEFGFDTTVMARSIFLRGFDQQMAEKIAEYMGNHGTKFIRPAVPKELKKVGEKIEVSWDFEGKPFTDQFDTVLVAIGRDADLSSVNLGAVGVPTTKSGKIPADNLERTGNPEGNIYALGDIVEGHPELTPLAIHQGKLLARRLFTNSTEGVDYDMIPTTVFTPIEYGCIGLPEEEAIARYGEAGVEVYHGMFKPLEWTVPHREDNACYAKLVCAKNEKERVVGFHYLGPNAAEVTQGYAVAMRMGATREQFANTIGIHPSTSEEVIKLKITKSSGEDATVSGC
ncbi:thioredoxin reductase 1 [Hyaloraphidium curvatum]|nr:thioredoxin reductase 1 [Hyaloraphidium curvatum]